jgi:tetratricopeptide (TPR) repeat protein
MQVAKAKAKFAINNHDMAAAESAYKEALAFAREVDDMHIAGELNNLAEICRSQGRLDESAAYLEEAEGIMVAMYGENHGLVGFLVHNLGRVRRQQKRWQDARTLHLRARAIREETQEAEPLSDTLWELAIIHRQLVEKEAAVEAFSACLAVSETLPAAVSPPTKLAGRRAALAVRARAKRATYDAFGDNWTSFRELEWKIPIFYGRAVRKL